MAKKERYQRVLHRVNQLRSRIELDCEGPEKETAKAILRKLETELKEFQINNSETKSVKEECSEYSESFESYAKQNVQTKSEHYANDYKEDFRSVDELVKDLGLVYLIFGSTYVTYFNYHVYKVRFLRKKKRDISKFVKLFSNFYDDLDEIDSDKFIQVFADIYEDDMLIVKNICIDICPYSLRNTSISDMSWSAMEPDVFIKYKNGGKDYLRYILNEMKELWNQYADSPKVPLLQQKSIGGYIETNKNKSVDVSLDEEQREQIVKKVEEKLDYSSKKTDIIHQIQAYRSYASLHQFLKESGVVYQVTNKGVLIWKETEFFRLAGYKYVTNLGPRHYILYLEYNI